MSEITRENWPERKKELTQREYDYRVRWEEEAKRRKEEDVLNRQNPQQFTLGELFQKYDEWVETLSDKNDEYWESEKDRAGIVDSFLEWIKE